MDHLIFLCISQFLVTVMGMPRSRSTKATTGQHLPIVENHVETVGHLARRTHPLLIKIDGELVINLAVRTIRVWIRMLVDVTEDEWA